MACEVEGAEQRLEGDVKGGRVGVVGMDIRGFACVHVALVERCHLHNVTSRMSMSSYIRGSMVTHI